MEEKRILIVEDSFVISQLVKHVLIQDGYQAFTAESGEEALRLIKKIGLPHLAVVDINLPGMDGFAFCDKLHSFSSVPVILLSSEEDEKVVAAGLKRYAEDYMIKPQRGPLRAEELKARVFTVLRRLGDFSYTLDPVVRVDDVFQIDFANRQAYVDGRKIRLTPLETKLLHILMHHAGRTLPFSYLLQRLWPLETAFDDRLHTHVYRLRKKIEKDPRSPTYLLSDWGKGYSFVAAALPE